MSAEVGARGARRPGSLGPGAALARRVLFAALSHVRIGALLVVLPDGSARRFGDPDAEPLLIEVVDERFFARLLRARKIGLGEGYTAGEWRTDDLVGVIELLARNTAAITSEQPIATLGRLAQWIPRLPVPKTLSRAEREIHAHYDLGNSLFELFLDETMTYSCAIFEHPGQSLADAQRAKYRRLCERLELGPDDHLLEIGSGWGGMAVHAARERGCRVTTTTISREQHAYAVARVRAAGLSDRVEVLYRDYRRLGGSFSKIVSIVMVEAIGHRQFATYFAAIDRLLARDGLVAVQSILIPDQRYEGYRRHPDWIRKHIFPGGLLPSAGVLLDAMRGHSRLGLVSLEEIGPHYATTLRCWSERFRANLAEVRALGFDDRFVRAWEYYLAFCEVGFRTRLLRDAQLVFARAGERSSAAVPAGVLGVEPSAEQGAGGRERVGSPAGLEDRDAAELGRVDRERPVVA
jgi:cyclopropane-fatty-acyl-phospholipid synthase